MAETIAIQAAGANGEAVDFTLHPATGAPTVNGTDSQPAVLLCDAPMQAGDSAHELKRAIVSSLLQAQLSVATVSLPQADTFDAYVNAAAAAFDALLERPEIDAARLGVLGWAVGGVIASALAGRAEHIARLSLLSPTTAADLTGRVARSKRAANVVDGRWRSESMRRSLKSITPAEDLAARECPVLIVHGAADAIVPCEVSLAYLNALEVAGRHVEHVLVARGDHFFTSPAVRAACLDQVVRFFSGLRASDTQPRARARSA